MTRDRKREGIDHRNHPNCYSVTSGNRFILCSDYRRFESRLYRFRSMITLNSGTFLLFRIRSIIH